MSGIIPSFLHGRSLEELLLEGLDHYFATRYEHAITVWTRVAFLERGHGRRFAAC